MKNELLGKRQSRCRAKRTYATRRDAKNAAKFIRSVGLWRKQIPYRCVECDLWHLTTQSKRRAWRKRNRARDKDRSNETEG